ncbi:phosphatidate phosphatase LPIN2-like isoform X2 [Amphiura filiformis]|uniref:phosphatidate phosphatase LPIN2-like isoform X2 n=1 Tax=Amphiura filiformis TaxID=82378 RepID=UPI003B20E694
MNVTMNYVGKVFTSLKTFYNELNPATLTGAIDVVVVEQEDGTFVCSPFHVRFGKMGVLRSREKVVYLEVNGEDIDLHMKLGENGEAFFVEETDETEDLFPPHLATSPIPSNLDMMSQGLKQLHAEVRKSEAAGGHDVRSETESSKDSDTPRLTEDENSKNSRIEEIGAIEETSQEVKDDHVVVTVDENLPKKGSSSEDVDAGNTPDELHSSTTDITPSLSKSSEDTVTIESEVKPSSRRVRNRRRRRRNDNRTSKNNNKPDLKAREIKRVVHVSESSTSSSQHSDDEIFQMEEYLEEEEEVKTPPMAEDSAVRFGFRGVEEVTPEEWNGLLQVTPHRDFHPLSDGDATPLLSPESTRPPTPKSDTELDAVRRGELKHNLKPLSRSSSTDKIEWNWGELPESPHDTKGNKDIEKGEDDSDSSKQGTARKSLWNKFNFVQNIKHSQGTEQGMYLQDLASEEVDPEVYALYFPESSVQVPSNRIRTIRDVKDDDKSSDLGNSLPQSPNTVGSMSPGTILAHHEENGEHLSIDLRMSLCGGLKEDEDTVPIDLFNKHEISYSEFCKNPSILANPNLVLRIGDKFYNWQIASPIIMSMVVFQRPLPEMVVSGLVKEHMPKNKRSLTSWLWGGSSSSRQTTPKKESGSQESGSAEEGARAEEKDYDRRDDEMSWGDELVESARERSEERSGGETERSEGEILPTNYKKSIRLSHEQLKQLNLKPGANEITYSVTTRYQGTAVCESTIYLWKYNSKIIVSDIDGTITKSDVMGQILPVLGRDWTHPGVANLYTSMKANGYEFLYLSSRAIGQARHTKGYLKSIIQDKVSLPDGPLLLNPSSLIRAFHSEVIIRKPEEFKIKCLQDIKSLFPTQNEEGMGLNPFYAGFGNRVNDSWAYKAVGIPISRIFTINPQGKITHDLTCTFQSSYPKLKDLVDHVFPSIHREQTAFEAPTEFSSFTFWRTPLLNIDLDDPLLSTKKVEKKDVQK